MDGPKYSQYDRVGRAYCDADVGAGPISTLIKQDSTPSNPLPRTLGYEQILHAFASRDHLLPNQIGLG